MKIKHAEDYRLLRQKEYPSIADQIEAMWAALPASARDNNPIYQKIQAVKAKYPKTAKLRQP